MVGLRHHGETKLVEPMSHPLQNRVAPTGEILAVPARGLFMGNRGGRIHDPETQTLSRRRWASRRWICCVTKFRGRRRQVMGTGYTELFFLDEATALAAGHRPCFECRREAAKAFVQCLAVDPGQPVPSVNELDALLHTDRLDGRSQRRFQAHTADLPDGAFVLIGEAPYALYRRQALVWTAEGYRGRVPALPQGKVTVLTPKSVCTALANGYRPAWHPSAETAFATVQDL